MSKSNNLISFLKLKNEIVTINKLQKQKIDTYFINFASIKTL
jgi:hypothetical protein